MSQDSFQINDDTIQKLMEEHKQLTSMFIHELRNPLSLIKGTLQYIEMKQPETKQYKYWSQLFELIHDMDIIMSDALLLNSGSSLNIKKDNLLRIIQATVDSYIPQADNQQKFLSLKIDPECESILSSYPCDSGKIKQVLSNLLKNAFEATIPGDFIEIILSIGSVDTNFMIKIQVINNGLPIPEEDIETIFLPFVTHKKGGTGVGLALSKRIIEGHLGSITVASSESMTEFTILLPLP